jgi:hypothetical protein
MGFTPEAVDRMSLWEFNACVAGHNKARGGEEQVAAPTPEEHDAMIRKFG